MANESRPLLVYTHRERSWERSQFGFQLLDLMAKAMRQTRMRHHGANLCLLAGIIAVLIAGPRAQAQPQFGQGFSGQGGPASPAENAAYSAAISQPNPEARVSAIQQFMIQYPNSALHQQAIAQMMQAKRQAGAPGAMTPQPTNQPMMQPMNRQMMQPPAAGPAVAAAPIAAPQPVGAPRDSLLQHPAKPAEVGVTPGSLVIRADNSSLSQILQQVSKSTGMKVEGLGQDERIFGNYGPGDPREVLLSLLDGFGYNVLMVGNDKGAPRELTLSRRAASGSTASSSPARNSQQADDDDVEQEQPQEVPQPMNQPNPGSAEGMQQPQRSPAEIQQELQRLRQQQQQQQQQQIPQPPQ